MIDIESCEVTNVMYYLLLCLDIVCMCFDQGQREQPRTADAATQHCQWFELRPFSLALDSNLHVPVLANDGNMALNCSIVQCSVRIVDSHVSST